MKVLCQFALCISAVAAPSAQAQQSVASAASTDAAAPVPATRYESAFTGYQRYRDEKPAPWRDLNDAARDAGGHIGILREADRRTRPAAGTHPAEHKSDL